MDPSHSVSTINNSDTSHLILNNDNNKTISQSNDIFKSPNSPHSPNSLSSDYLNNNGISLSNSNSNSNLNSNPNSDTIDTNNTTTNNNNPVSNNLTSPNNNIQFKNYTVRNPPGFQQQQQQQQQQTSVLNDENIKLRDNHYPTPNHTPIPTSMNNSTTINNNNNNNNNTTNNNNNNMNNSQNTTDNQISVNSTNISISTSNASELSSRRKSIINEKDIKPIINDLKSGNFTRDANGYPILSREFVVRRISEGETGRLKEELKCEACGKGYKHITSLAKHLWEHTAEWQSTKKLLISKHQQVQLLEAASILCSLSENEISSISSNGLSNTSSNSSINNDSSILLDSKDLNKIHNLIPHHNIHYHQPLANAARRKSKSENSKAGKFGGKRRSKSFSVQNGLQLNTLSNHPHHHKLNGLETTDNHTTTTTTTTTNNNNNNNGLISSIRRGSNSILPPSDLRRSSINVRPSVNISLSRRGSLLGSLIKEEENVGNDSLVIYDSEDED
jgi:hypothetical protein